MVIVAFWIDLQIVLALGFKDIREPRIVPPIGLNDDCISVRKNLKFGLVGIPVSKRMRLINFSARTDRTRQKRIGFVAADPTLPIRAFFDVSRFGATSDAMAIWVVQWVGNQVNVLDYIEGQGQVLAYYVNELRSRKWNPVCYLPHDGINANNVTGKRYRDHLEDAG